MEELRRKDVTHCISLMEALSEQTILDDLLKLLFLIYDCFIMKLQIVSYYFVLQLFLYILQKSCNNIYFQFQHL